MKATLIQIVPRRAIAPEGVGDYARLIAEQMFSDRNVRTVFISGTPLPRDQRLHDSWETYQLPSRSSDALLETLRELGSDIPILLHLSAYGYQDRGVPLWLAGAMEHWRRTNPATPLVTVFHELFAFSPPWRSSFWLGHVQKRIARRIQRVSNAAIATTGSYAALLERWRDDDAKRTIVLPVFSTIGAPATTPRVSARPATLVIFGRSGIFDGVYRRRLRDITAFVAANEITEIVDVGTRLSPPPAAIGAARVRSMGQLPAADLQAELTEARFGLLDYDADRLAKSTVFAAYCAHGAIPVCLSDSSGCNDGLRPGGNYIRLCAGSSPARLAPDVLESLQRGAEDWYQPHSLKSSTDTIRKLFGDRDDLAKWT